MAEVGKCPKCGTSVGDRHDYTLCSKCGEPLPTVVAVEERLDHERSESTEAGQSSSPTAGSASPILVGALVGAVLGYPLSYYFQPGGFRAKISLGQYIERLSDVVGDDELQSAVFIGFLVAIGAGAGIGWLIQNARQSAK